MKPKIIGFSAKKQGGKTTAVMDLAKRINKGEHVSIINFADELKTLVARTLIPEDQTPFTMRFSSCIESKKNEILPCGLTGREALQKVGTDWFRNLWPEVWVNSWIRQVKWSSSSWALVGDVRFPNEVRAIQSLGGHVIRLTRAPFADIDQHVSETALDLVEYLTMYPLEAAVETPPPCGPFDAIIDNRDMTIEEQNESVWKLVNERGWL